MREVDPLILFFARDERAALVAELRDCRALTLAALVDRVGRRRRPEGRERLAIVTAPERVSATIDLAIDRLPSLTRPRFRARAEGLSFATGVQPGRIAFLFPGQGSEHVGMLRALYDRAPLVRGWFDDLDLAAVELGEPPLSTVIYPTDAPPHARDARQMVSDMKRGAQLGVVADLALHDVVRALGVRADAYVGHSNGEHAAVIAAGRIAGSRADLCRRSVELGLESERLSPPARPEALIAVTLNRGRLLTLLERYHGTLSLAMDNSPTQAVVGGYADAADAFGREIAAAGGLALRLPFTRAYRTPVFADRAAMFAAHYRGLSIRPGQVPVYSCRSREPLPDGADECRDEMTRQWTTMVDFRGTIERLHAEGVGTFVEIGPDSKLTAFVEDTLRGRPHVAVGTNSPARHDVGQLAHLMGELFVAGVALDPTRLSSLLKDVTGGRGSEVGSRTEVGGRASSVWRVAAEVHPRLIADAKQRLARAALLVAAPRSQPIAPLLGASAEFQTGSLRTCRRFTRVDDPFVDDHALGRQPAAAAGYPLPVLAFTMSLEIAAEAAHRMTGQPVNEIRDARASRWLALERGVMTIGVEAAIRQTDRAIGVTIRESGDQEIRKSGNQEIRESGQRGTPKAFECRVPQKIDAASPFRIDRDPDARGPVRWSAATFYKRYAFHGPSFQGLSRIMGIGKGSIEADVTITRIPGLPPETLQMDPAMLDCAGQLVAFWLLEQERMEPTFGIFPFAMRALRWYRTPLPVGAQVRCRGRVARTSLGTSASFVFETVDGGAVASVEGFSQRLIQLPYWLGRRLFAGEPVPSPPLADVEATGLFTPDSIWERALAHLTLPAPELDAWAAMDHPSSLRWLLPRIA